LDLDDDTRSLLADMSLRLVTATNSLPDNPAIVG
jgi:hypothetical protein